MRLLLLALAVAAPLASAQETAPRAEGTTVTYSLRTTIPEGDAPVPAVLTALASDPHLARLDVSTFNARSTDPQPVEAVFVFGSVAAYTAWRESDRVVSLLADLEAGSTRGVETAVQFRRLPLSNAVPDEG